VTLDWKWKTAFVVFAVYMMIARYCAFKLAMGFSTLNCTCG
jgi:hypothetical protein